MSNSGDKMPNFIQDWDHVIIKKRQVDRQIARNAAAANRIGAPKVTFSSDAALQRKLAESDEIGQVKIKTLAPETRQEIVQRRVANGWNQQQLNQQCGFPANLIRDIESGRVTPSPTQLNILNRILRASLRNR
jgi:ribosome-binding protein aMBF1 (putative translation factor)